MLTKNIKEQSDRDQSTETEIRVAFGTIINRFADDWRELTFAGTASCHRFTPGVLEGRGAFTRFFVRFADRRDVRPARVTRV